MKERCKMKVKRISVDAMINILVNMRNKGVSHVDMKGENDSVNGDRVWISPTEINSFIEQSPLTMEEINYLIEHG